MLCAASALVSLTAKTELLPAKDGAAGTASSMAPKRELFGAENLPRKKATGTVWGRVQ